MSPPREDRELAAGVEELWARMRLLDQASHQRLDVSGYILDLAHHLIASSDRRLSVSRQIRREYLHGTDQDASP
jgi:hypothetical protein